MTQKLLEMAYRSVPKVEGRPFFFLKLRFFLVRKLFELYYHITVIVENSNGDKEQALSLMNLSLNLCKEFNSSHNLEKYKVNDRPVIAKMKSL